MKAHMTYIGHENGYEEGDRAKYPEQGEQSNEATFGKFLQSLTVQWLHDDESADDEEQLDSQISVAIPADRACKFKPSQIMKVHHPKSRKEPQGIREGIVSFRVRGDTVVWYKGLNITTVEAISQNKIKKCIIADALHVI